MGAVSFSAEQRASASYSRLVAVHHLRNAFQRRGGAGDVGERGEVAGAAGGGLVEGARVLRPSLAQGAHDVVPRRVELDRVDAALGTSVSASVLSCSVREKPTRKMRSSATDPSACPARAVSPRDRYSSPMPR